MRIHQTALYPCEGIWSRFLLKIANENRSLIMNYDVIIIGAGPGGIFTAYELLPSTA